MPSLRKVTYECSICRQEYSSGNENTARNLAKACERQRTPFVHRFRPGTELNAITKDPAGTLMYSSNGGAIEIVGWFFERKTHRPMYRVKFSDITVCDSMPAENILFRTVVYRFTSAVRPVSGEVVVEEIVASSMEPSS